MPNTCIPVKNPNTWISTLAKVFRKWIIYILTGEAEYKRESIVDEYMQLNQSIETSVIEKSKHFPHMENVSGFLNAVSDYLIQ